MKTINELLAEFDLLERGENHDIEFPGVAKFTINLSWQEEQVVNVRIAKRQVAGNIIELFGCNISDDNVEEVYRKYHADRVAAFQKRIEDFDEQAVAWGVTNHNNAMAFYENHVW